MADDLLTCPFCGMQFSREDTLCQHGCPLGSLCTLVRCPNCLYEYPAQPDRKGFWRKVLGRRIRPVKGHPARVTTVLELEAGERAVVMTVGDERAGRHNALAVFGIVPGSAIRLLQRQPACVVRVGETELALEPAIAKRILVQRAVTAEPRPPTLGG